MGDLRVQDLQWNRVLGFALDLEAQEEQNKLFLVSEVEGFLSEVFLYFKGTVSPSNNLIKVV